MARVVSRYRPAPKVTLGSEVHFGPRRPPDIRVAGSDQYRRVVEGDTLPLLAFRMLGDDRFWWVLADFNQILDPRTPLVPGTILRAPGQARLHLSVLND